VAILGGYGELHSAFQDHQHEVAGITLVEHAGLAQISATPPTSEQRRTVSI
jgi:hypothetical protein